MAQMADSRGLHILTINSGSSSIKFAVFTLSDESSLAAPAAQLSFSGSLDKIGNGGRFRIHDSRGRPIIDASPRLENHRQALNLLFDRLPDLYQDEGKIGAIGHRIVHGGEEFEEPQMVTGELVARLDKLVPLAPDHLPRELDAVKIARRRFPSLPQVACFDTAFHRNMPPEARFYALPRELRRAGVMRYGFHGLSYEYITWRLSDERMTENQEKGRDPQRGQQDAGSRPNTENVIIAHLGNGASMAAVKDAKSIDTTMGFTPAGGLVMSDRSGDMDPGVLIFLAREKGYSPGKINHIVNKESGLLGVSQTSSDMETLLQQEASDSRAAEAVEMFCYQARKFLGALAAALGGLDTLVFTGGIGENSPPVRARICEGLEFMGISVDHGQNQAGSTVISAPGTRVTVRVIPTDEELMIARHTAAILNVHMSTYKK